MKAEIMILGLLMMYYNSTSFTEVHFITGLAIFTIGLYLALQGYFGNSFSGCIFGSCDLTPKKKGFFKK